MRNLYPIFKQHGIDSCLSKLYPFLRPLGPHRFTSTQSAVEKVTPSPERLQLKIPTVQKWKRPPFVKNMFLGKFDVHLMPFQEVVDRESLAELEKGVSKVKEVFQEKVNSLQIEEQRKVSPEVVQDLKDLGLYGRIIPQEYGGLGLTMTQCVRLNEALSPDWSIGSTLTANEFFGIQALLLFGTEAQKEKYLPDLATGKKTIAVCCNEPECGWDPTNSRTTCTVTEEATIYSITGTKTWVTNADQADLLVVFARDTSHSISEEQPLVVFLVDKDSKGITVSPYTDTIGLMGTNCGTVKFENVEVPEGNIIGKDVNPLFLINKLREWVRFGIGSLTTGVLKTMLDNVAEYVIDAERHSKPLCENELVQQRLSSVALKIYAMESVTYFTAGYYDSTENPDASAEMTIMKIHNTEATLYCLQELMLIMGSLSLSKSLQFEKFYRDAQALALFEGHNDMARLFVGLLGCKVAGTVKSEEVRKHRNPFFYPWERVQYVRKNYSMYKNKFEYTDDVAGHVHPSLKLQADNLEECVQRLSLATEQVLVKHGNDVSESQFDPVRLANLAINVYARTAVLSRGSRSYCLGNKNCHEELKLVETFCDMAQIDFLKTFLDVMQGSQMKCTDHQAVIGQDVVKGRGFYAEHPLVYNF